MSIKDILDRLTSFDKKCMVKFMQIEGHNSKLEDDLFMSLSNDDNISIDLAVAINKNKEIYQKIHEHVCILFLLHNCVAKIVASDIVAFKLFMTNYIEHPFVNDFLYDLFNYVKSPNEEDKFLFYCKLYFIYMSNDEWATFEAIKHYCLTL